MSKSSSKLNKELNSCSERQTAMGSKHLCTSFLSVPTSRPSLACPWAISEASYIVSHVTASHTGQGNHNMTAAQLRALPEKLACSLLDTKGAGPFALGPQLWDTEPSSHCTTELGVRRTGVAMLKLRLFTGLWIIKYLAPIHWVPLSAFSIYRAMARQLACISFGVLLFFVIRNEAWALAW